MNLALIQVKADVETQGDFVQSLATEVRASSFTNIEDVVSFVNWLDEELSFLVCFSNFSLLRMGLWTPIVIKKRGKKEKEKGWGYECTTNHKSRGTADLLCL